MKTLDSVHLADVQAVYAGPEGALWKLIMGEQIHIGGLAASLDLAARADIPPRSAGIDLCCCTGAGMRFLLRFRNVARMTGVDATLAMVAQGRDLSAAEGFADQISFLHADVTASGLPSASADFVWGEDAWCYVADKHRLIAEAARLVRPGGIIAFTDWVEGPARLSDPEALRFLRFMKFPSLHDIPGYAQSLRDNGCTILAAEDTRRFPRAIDLYLQVLTDQLAYDALKILNFNHDLLAALAAEMHFTRDLAHAGKIAQALFIARKI